jgi:hypothetical protein
MITVLMRNKDAADLFGRGEKMLVSFNVVAINEETELRRDDYRSVRASYIKTVQFTHYLSF